MKRRQTIVISAAAAAVEIVGVKRACCAGDGASDIDRATSNAENAQVVAGKRATSARGNSADSRGVNFNSAAIVEGKVGEERAVGAGDAVLAKHRAALGRQVFRKHAVGAIDRAG